MEAKGWRFFETHCTLSYNKINITYSIASLVPVSVHFRSDIPVPSADTHQTHVYVSVSSKLSIQMTSFIQTQVDCRQNSATELNM